MEPKWLPSCSTPLLLITYTRQREVLVTVPLASLQALLRLVHISLVLIPKHGVSQIGKEVMCCHSFSHLCVICHCFVCLMSMFQDHVTRQNFTLTKPLYVDKFLQRTWLLDTLGFKAFRFLTGFLGAQPSG